MMNHQCDDKPSEYNDELERGRFCEGAGVRRCVELLLDIGVHGFG